MPQPLRHYMYHLPNDFFAMGPIQARSEREARAIIRQTWKLKRLPKGAEVWESRGKISG